MQIQVNADHSVATPEGFADNIRETIEHILSNCECQITRIEVHVSVVSGRKTGYNDKHCVMEARIAGRKPIAVTDQAATLDEVINGAAEKLKHAIESILDKQHDHHPRFSGGGIVTDKPILKN